MKAYGAKRIYAGCRTKKPLGKPIKVIEGDPKNPKRERATAVIDEAGERIRP